MKKGDITTPMFMWFAGVIVGIVLVTWLMKSSSFSELDFSDIDEDLKNIHYEISLACNHDQVESTITLYSRKGNFIYNETSICILKYLTNGNITRCLGTPCSLPAEGSLDIASSNKIFLNKTLDGNGNMVLEVVPR